MISKIAESYQFVIILLLLFKNSFKVSNDSILALFSFVSLKGFLKYLIMLFSYYFCVFDWLGFFPPPFIVLTRFD